MKGRFQITVALRSFLSPQSRRKEFMNVE